FDLVDHAVEFRSGFSVGVRIETELHPKVASERGRIHGLPGAIGQPSPVMASIEVDVLDGSADLLLLVALDELAPEDFRPTHEGLAAGEALAAGVAHDHGKGVGVRVPEAHAP